MKPYQRNSLYRFAVVRRCVYGRGHGVHSPKAYALIQQLVRPRGSYYRLEENAKLFEDPVLRLAFRAVARLNPKHIVLNSSYSSLREAITLAYSQISFVEELTVGTQKIIFSDEIRAWSLGEKDLLVLLSIRANKDSEKCFIELTEQMTEGIIIDLYDHAIIANVPNVRYLYRSSF